MKRTLLILCFSFIIIWQLSAQICDGNLGENIFTEGDFGSGTANVLVPDPQIAPGYNYQTSPPPNDGWYTITNNTTNWGSFAATYWSNIEDNSSDPNGYMMVVNASYSPGLFYEQVVDGLCENTLYVFSADVFNLYDAIKPNISFLIDGATVYTTGAISFTGSWETFGFTFSTNPGQTSVTLSLQNNAPGGIGNDLALDNITFRPCGPKALILPEEIANICEDGSPIDLEATINGTQYDTPVVQWQQSFDQGNTWENIPGANSLTYTHTQLQGGFYYYRYLLANDPANLLNSKCRVVSNVKIVYVVPKYYTIIDTLCEGLSFTLGNNLFSETGIYVDSLITTIGCDSIVTLDLTIVPNPGINATFNSINPSCVELQDGSINIETIINGTEPYSIFINGEQNINGNLFNLPEGEFEYLIADYFGCHFTTIINLQTPAPYFIELGDDVQIDLGESILINPFYAAPFANNIWSSTELIDCNNCENLNITPTFSSTYVLMSTSQSGCSATDSIYVQVNTVRNVFIPNAFSPNDDGINDFFTIYGTVPNVQMIEQLTVFDRWGGIVFENQNFLPNDQLSGWDGTAHGKKLPAGTYAYFTKIKFLDEVVVLYEGDVVLVR